jgi:hypothetical protein
MNRTTCLLAAAGMLSLPLLSQAQPSAHYVPGVEGIKAATLPPPGFYVRDYNYFYWANQLNDSHGSRNPRAENFSGFIYANTIRAIWITDFQLLGGYYGMDALIPLVDKEVSVGRAHACNFDAGDICLEPATFSWHGKQYDAAVGYAIWIPTAPAGSINGLPNMNAGNGYWTHMLTLGGTLYFDKDKTWSFSVLNRYEINTESRDTLSIPGQVLTMEGGFAKALSKIVEVGVVGYYQQQTTRDSDGSSADRDRVFGLGPEVSVTIPDCMTFVSLRYLCEFEAQSRMQGNTIALTLTKRF